MARGSAQPAPKIVDETQVQHAFAKAVADGDIVNFRFLFAPFSPARVDSTESFDDPKYAYLLPDDEQERATAFTDALGQVKKMATWAHIKQELDAKRPPQLPSDLLLPLADNAVRLGKWTAAGQAYELLRVRRRMLELLLDEAMDALNRDDVAKAVRGFRMAAGLSYDYAAFPEPLPMVPVYQERALALHGTYPTRPEQSIALAPPEQHVQLALSYLLGDEYVAGRLNDRPLDTQLRFLRELVEQVDPAWDDFGTKFEKACDLTRSIGERLRRRGENQPSLAEEVEEQQAEDPWDIPRALLGRDIPEGAWWEYLKDLAYLHPAAVLFISRQLVGEEEILMPRLLKDSPVPKALGLDVDLGESSNSPEKQAPGEPE